MLIQYQFLDMDHPHWVAGVYLEQEGSHSDVGDGGCCWWASGHHRSPGNLAPLEDKLALIGVVR